MKKIILTCEHGGAQIPKRYKKLFSKNKSILKTHRALDIGALGIARDLQKILKLPLEYSTVSRLLIDLNRFLDSDTLFSEFTDSLSIADKNKIIGQYYWPHWQKITRQLQGLISKKHQVIHIAIHSMTDKLHGKSRPMQLALLYDPLRKTEKHFAKLWMQELRKEFPNFKIARNNPYRGNGEGLTTSLRKMANQRDYIGIELEMNQGYLKTLKSTKDRKQFSKKLALALQRAFDNFV